MNKQHYVLPVRAKRFFSAGLLILSLLAGSCSAEDPIVDENEKEKEEEPQTPSSYTVAINDGKADMPPGGGLITAEFSDFAAGEHVGKLVDNDAASQFSTPHQKFYLLWNCNKPAVVNRYAVASGLGSTANDPKAWTLSASNDKQAWTQLDSRSNQSFAGRGEEKLIPFENETLYKYYRLEILSNGGGASTEMTEWSLERYSVEVEEGVSDLPYGGGVITPQYAFFSNGCGAGMLADCDPVTVYETPYSSFYLLWLSNETQLVNHYSLTAGGGAAGSSPVAWTLYGSTNNDNWITLDEQEGQQFAEGGETKEYLLENETEYKYYKLEVRANGGAASTLIAEWGMQEIYTSLDDLMGFASGYSHSDQTPMGNHYANRHVTTDADRAWLLEPTNEPPAPASASHLFLVDFPVDLYPYGTPLPADVNQHAIGNCGGVAAMASMAYAYPDFVTTLIHDNGDNSYTVSMFDPQGQPVEVAVTARFLTGNGSNIDAVSGKNNKATWATVLEKAIMKYNVVYKVNPDIGGIGSEHVIPLFTGNGDSFAFSPGKLTNRQLKQAVEASLRLGKMVIGGFNRGDLSVDGSKTVTAHAYTLMHSSSRDALFAMRNPWGGNPGVDGTADGVLNIPDNGVIPPTIDLRIVDPGLAGNYGDGALEPYTPPTLRGVEAQMRVSSYLLRPGASIR